MPAAEQNYSVDTQEGGVCWGARFWRVTAALALITFSTSLMNSVVFPLFDPIFTYARDISVTVSAVVMISIGLIASLKPQWLHMDKAAEIGIAICLVVGAVLMMPALIWGNGILLITAASLFAAGRAGATLMMGLAATGFNARTATACIGIAFTATFAANSIVWVAPIVVGVVLFLLCPLVAYLLTYSFARQLFAEIAKAPAPADVAVTQPSTFLPLASQFFVCLLLFHLAFGYGLRFGEVGGVPASNMIGFVVIAAVSLYTLVRRSEFQADVLMRVAVLLVAAGFFLATASPKVYYLTASALLITGNSLFEMVAWLVLIMLAGRNPLNALAVFAWGRGVCSLGSLIGAALGVWSNQLFAFDRDLFVYVPCLLMLLTVGYALFGMRTFSFKETIQGVAPSIVQPQDALANASHADSTSSTPDTLESQPLSLQERCTAVAQEYGLSPRECEVFELLAEGRDRTYIQEQLVISRNTVKAHVKHIYAKLDIHTHQDLIALVRQDESRADYS